MLTSWHLNEPASIEVCIKVAYSLACFHRPDNLAHNGKMAYGYYDSIHRFISIFKITIDFRWQNSGVISVINVVVVKKIFIAIWRWNFTF